MMETIEVPRMKYQYWDLLETPEKSVYRLNPSEIAAIIGNCFFSIGSIYTKMHHWTVLFGLLEGLVGENAWPRKTDSYYWRMRKLPVAVLLLTTSLALVSCGEETADESKEVQTYSQCLETEAAKLLDETGSNLDYANEMAAKACESLQ
jgi:hypothetical protein